MRSLRDLSGPWVGFWVQGLERGEMRLTLRFGDSGIEGEGSDPIGPFTVSGRHEPTAVLRFDKHYDEQAVEYHGTWNGAMISGRWSFGRREFGFANSGGFEIWPEGDDEAIGRMESALAASV